MVISKRIKHDPKHDTIIIKHLAENDSNLFKTSSKHDPKHYHKMIQTLYKHDPLSNAPGIL